MTAGRIRILLVDDHTLVREGVRMLIEGHDDLQLVGEAWDRAGALEAVERERPDVVLLDLDLGAESGLDLIPEIVERGEEARVLVLTGVRDPELQRRALRLGAIGIVAKEKAAAVLLSAVRKVHAGEAWVDRGMMGALLREAPSLRTPRDPEAARIASLTARERQVVELVAEGNGTARLAERLGINEKTVRNHLVSIYAKLGVSDRLELAIYAGRHGLAAQGR